MRVLTPPKRRRIPPIAVALTLVAAACGGDDAQGGDFSVADLLTRVPSEVLSGTESGDTIELSFGDLRAAGAVVGIERPSDQRNLDDTIDWLNPLTGGPSGDTPPTVFVPPPQLIGSRLMVDFEGYVDELGFGPAGIDTFVEASIPPNRFTVLTGDIGFPDGLLEVSPGVRTIGEGDDQSTVLDEVTPLRPLGRPLRVAERDGLLAASLLTPPIEAWVSGEGESLADTGRFADVARALDSVGVVGAYIVDGSFFSPISLDLLETEIDEDLLASTSSAMTPFTTVGLGWNADDQGALGVAVYWFGTADAADANLDAVRAAYDADSLVTESPISDRVTVDSVNADGATVIATLRFTDQTTPSVTLNMLFQRDVIFNYR